MQKKQNNQAWFLVLPVFLSVAFSAIIPLMTVVNYSVQDILGPDRRLYVGTEWYHAVLNSPELHAAFFRQLIFSFSVLLIEIPLGLMVALILPVRGWLVSLCLVLLAIPLLIPWNVVGTIWQIFARGDIGLGGSIINHLGIPYNYTLDPTDAWVTVLVMDIWHWTSLVVLLCYAGLRAIPDAYYQAAAIDGASRLAVFRYIQLPKLSGVLSIAVLLRFMDSFMVYTEPFVLTGGGPGSSTTFLSQYLVNIGLGQFDLGNGGAFSLIYFLIILLFCYVFYTTVQNLTKGKE